MVSTLVLCTSFPSVPHRTVLLKHCQASKLRTFELFLMKSFPNACSPKSPSKCRQPTYLRYYPNPFERKMHRKVLYNIVMYRISLYNAIYATGFCILENPGNHSTVFILSSSWRCWHIVQEGLACFKRGFSFSYVCLHALDRLCVNVYKLRKCVSWAYNKYPTTAKPAIVILLTILFSTALIRKF